MDKIINGSNAQQNNFDEKQQLAALAQMIRNADDVKCDSCGSLNFLNIYRIRRISGLISGTGKDMIVPVPVYACSDCGHVNEKFLKGVGLDKDEPKDTPFDGKSNLNNDGAI